MERYSHLNDLHELEFKTLKGIHEALGIKQGLKNYVRNTNKKYGKNYAQDEEKFEAAKSFVESSLKSGKQPFAILQEIRTRYSVPLETQIALNL